MYAKLENGVLLYAPVNYLTSTGSLIVNFNKNPALMREYGFKKVIDNKPSYNNSTEYLTISGYTENEENIMINYSINEIEEYQEKTLEERVAELEKVNQEQNELINTTMMATDEIFTMIEPLLPESICLERSVSKMVDMYVAMVIRGLKTIDQVPARYREQVKEILSSLERD